MERMHAKTSIPPPPPCVSDSSRSATSTTPASASDSLPPLLPPLPFTSAPASTTRGACASPSSSSLSPSDNSVVYSLSFYAHLCRLRREGARSGATDVVEAATRMIRIPSVPVNSESSAFSRGTAVGRDTGVDVEGGVGVAGLGWVDEGRLIRDAWRCWGLVKPVAGAGGEVPGEVGVDGVVEGEEVDGCRLYRAVNVGEIVVLLKGTHRSGMNSSAQFVVMSNNDNTKEYDNVAAVHYDGEDKISCVVLV
ncbi:hypothetical protein R3P38DRAFT_3350567 [Favolaschia claudopus]|uniref:Uncharacterized protein n=1 Tax=Favolaschia claudopus TaxID=2862362 RepID=A0AAW0CI32_9AGAR